MFRVLTVSTEVVENMSNKKYFVNILSRIYFELRIFRIKSVNTVISRGISKLFHIWCNFLLQTSHDMSIFCLILWLEPTTQLKPSFGGRG